MPPPHATDLATSTAAPIGKTARTSELGSLFAQRSFWGMTATQFLGAFNDGVFKQIVLLLCVNVVWTRGDRATDKQSLATAVFALSFVMFSGIAGWWSDRISKRTLVVAMKFAEIAIMALGVGAFALLDDRVQAERIVDGKTITVEATSGLPWFVLGVLFLMGAQSAVFGPAKYGILPELVPQRQLPLFNGAIQMTTFLALILGPALAGWLSHEFSSSLWKAGCVCVCLAVLGTATSFLVRSTPVAQPNAPFSWSAVAMSPETWRVLRADRQLVWALLIYSLFWFVAAIIPLSLNDLGKNVFRIDDKATSLMPTSISIGIAIGFILASLLSANRVRFGLVRLGAWGLIVLMPLMALSRPAANHADGPAAGTPRGDAPAGGPTASTAKGPDGAAAQAATSRHLLGYRGSQMVLALMGICAGLFALPVQVFMQSRPPEHLKGRVIGTMNLINWIAMIASAGFYEACLKGLQYFGLPMYGTFAAVAVLLVPVALFYRPKDVVLA